MNNHTAIWTEGLKQCRSCLSKYWLEFWHALTLFSLLMVMLFIDQKVDGIAIAGVAMFLFAKMIYPLGKISKNQKLMQFSWVFGVVGFMIFLNLVLTNYQADTSGNPDASLIRHLVQHYITF